MKKLVWLIFISIPVALNILTNEAFYIASGLYFVMGILLNQRSFSFFKRWKFWIFVIFVVLTYPLIMPGKDIRILGIPIFARKYLIESVKIAITGIVMFTWIFVVTGYTRPQDIAAFFARLGMKDIGEYITITLNLLPIIVNSVEYTYLAMKLRGGFGWSPRRIELFFITVFRNVILLAENLTIAIALEGF